MSLVSAVVEVAVGGGGVSSVVVTATVTLLPMPKAPVTVTPDGMLRLAKLR